MRLKLTLLTGRTIEQGRGKEFGKLSKEYQESASICELDVDDMNHFGIRDNENVTVITDFGSVVLKAKESIRSPHKGIAFIPYGPWANVVMDPQTHGSGMPSYKGIPAEIVKSRDRRVLNIKELLREYYAK